MNRKLLTAVVLGAVWSGWLALPSLGKTPPKLYAFCVGVGVPGRTAPPLAQQAKLLRELGYDGLGLTLPLDDELGAELKLLDEGGLQEFMFWASVDINPAKPAVCDPRLLASIRKLKGRLATVCVLLGGVKPGAPEGMDAAVKLLRELGDTAAQAPVRISIYNHVGNWTESLPFIIDVVRKVNHPQVGFHPRLAAGYHQFRDREGQTQKDAAGLHQLHRHPPEPPTPRPWRPRALDRRHRHPPGRRPQS
jgi:sugar phosphate isomerase/epimerase